jgi:3-deoxy-D-manno-octulosonic acid kinase
LVVPEGFVSLVRGRLRLIAREEWAEDAVRAGVLDHADPRRWTGMGKALAGGRGGISRMRIGADRPLDLVVKPLLRGGALRHVNRDMYLTDGRLLQEARLSVLIRNRGVPASDMVFGRAQTIAGPIVRLHLATVAVSDAVPLLALLDSAATSGDQAGAAVRAAGGSVLALHDAGIMHADLNLNNLLVPRSVGGGMRATVIDLDGSRIVSEMSGALRARNLARLLRHAVKNGLRERRDLAVLGRAFLEGYCPQRDPAPLEKRVLQEFRRTYPLHRLSWRFQGLRVPPDPFGPSGGS